MSFEAVILTRLLPVHRAVCGLNCLSVDSTVCLCAELWLAAWRWTSYRDPRHFLKHIETVVHFFDADTHHPPSVRAHTGVL
jgi:hypothetical protein